MEDRPRFDQVPAILESDRPIRYPATATPKPLSQHGSVGQRPILAGMIRDVAVGDTAPQGAAQAAQARMRRASAEVKERHAERGPGQRGLARPAPRRPSRALLDRCERVRYKHTGDAASCDRPTVTIGER